MAKESFSGLMLFSKEKLHYPYKYRLYFIDVNTLKGKNPSIHRFCVRCNKDFESYEVGGVYNILASELNIVAVEKQYEADIDDELYYSLVYLRDLIFMEEDEGKYVGLEGEAYTADDYYWGYSDYKNIISYKPDYKTKALYVLIKFFLYLFAIVLPMGIYMMVLYGFATTRMRVSICTIPSVAVLCMPLVIWMMNFIFLMGEVIILNIPLINMMTYKKYALRWAGMRRSGDISARTKREITSGLIISLGCILLCVFLNLIL